MMTDEDLILNRVPKKRKEDHRKLFVERLQFEGRYQEYRDTITRLMLERGCAKELPVLNEARRICGIKDPDEERELARERRGNQEIIENAVEIDDRVLAMLGLPATVTFNIEMDWVCGHPKMIHAKDWNPKGDEKRVMIQLSDVQAPPHGRAPSIRAVTMLGYYVNKPGDFFKMVAGLEKEGDGGAAAESQRDIKQIESILRELGEPA